MPSSTYLSSSRTPSPQSAISTLASTHPPPPGVPSHDANHILALQVSHNLRYQHLWTDLRMHVIRVTAPSANGGSQTRTQILLSALPNTRLYVHEDEQIEQLQLARAKKSGKSPGIEDGGGVDLTKPEREWILPSHLREKWSLRRWAQIFDGIGIEPEANDGVKVFGDEDDDEQEDGEEEEEEEEEEGRGERVEMKERETNKWRITQPKRILLATVDDDGTVVYYVLHDGLVKPRQN